MQTKIGHFSMVMNFLDIDFSTRQISDILKEEIEDLLLNSEINGPSDWTLLFAANYTNARQPLVSKNKLGSYLNDKTKEVTVIIPVPTIKVVSWGVHDNQHIYKENHFDKLIKNFYPLDIQCTDHCNRTSFILACMREGIKVSFEEGFTVNKVKLKLKRQK